jgi:cell division protein FtsB
MSNRVIRRIQRPRARTGDSPHRRWPWLIVFLLFATLVAVCAGDRGLVRLLHLRAEQRRIEAKNAQIEADNTRLREEVHRLRVDRGTIEKIAREELGMARPGEIVYEFAPAGTLPGVPPTLPEPPIPGPRRVGGPR